MSTALLSICLWIGASPAALPQEETPKPSPAVSPEAVTPPPLRLSSSTMDEYHLAMHLIDVRGKNEEGAEKLLALVDLPDVIAYPGQASWLLTQASRALTLAGKTEEAKQLLPGIRRGSQGTSFASAVQSQLSQFSPNQYGIDPSFLRYLLSTRHSNKTFGHLHQEFGRSLLPYFQFIVEDPNQEYDLGLRKNAAGSLYCLLNEETKDWFLPFILGADDITQKMLLSGVKSSGPGWSQSFIDEGAQRVAAGIASELARHFGKSNPARSLQILWDYLVWPNPSPELGDGVEWQKVLSTFESEFLNSSKEQIYEYSILLMREVYDQKERFLPTLNSFAHCEDAVTKEMVRWDYWHDGKGENLLAEWATSGDDQDLIRFSLINPYLNHKANDDANKEMQRWRRSFFPFDENPYRRPRFPSGGDVPESYLRIFESCSQSSHPLVRFQAASALAAYGQPSQAIRFLEDLGADSTWAVHLLNTWFGGSLDTEEVQLLLDLGIGTPVEQEVKNLIGKKGHGGITVPIWREYGLTIPAGGASDLIQELWLRQDVEGLAWIVMDSKWPSQYLGTPFNYLKNLSPSRALTVLESVPNEERDGLLLFFDNGDWMRMLQEEGPKVNLREHIEVLRAHIEFPLSANRGSNSLLTTVALEDMNLALEIVLDSPFQDVLARELVSARLDTRANSPALQEQFLQETISTFHAEDLSTKGTNLLHLCLVNDVPQVRLMRILWSRQGDSHGFDRKMIPFILRYPALRTAFHQDLANLLKEKQHITKISSGLEEEDAVTEFLDPLIELCQPSLSKEDLTIVLRVLGTVDDQRVIDTLLQFTSDSRVDVRNMAMSQLSSLQQSRELQQKWAAWANGQEETTALLALLEDLKDPDIEVRLGAVKALGLLGDPEALPVLVDLLRENNPIKHAAQEALDRMATTKKD